MSDRPVQLIVATFDDESSAQANLSMLKEMQQEKEVALHGAILMTKDPTGHKISYKDVGLTPGKGALGGVVLGAAVGILTGGTGLVLGAAGALLGSLVGRKKQDKRFSAEQINQVAASLKPGAGAIVAVIEPEGVEALEARFEAVGAEVLTADVSVDLAQQLKAQQDQAYAALMKELEPEQPSGGSE